MLIRARARNCRRHEVGVDEKTTAFPGNQKAVVAQAVVSECHSVACHIQLGRQRTARWQGLLRPDVAAGNRRNNLLDNLFLQTVFTGGIELKKMPDNLYSIVVVCAKQLVNRMRWIGTTRRMPLALFAKFRAE